MQWLRIIRTEFSQQLSKGMCVSPAVVKAALRQRPYLAVCYLSHHSHCSEMLAPTASVIHGSERGRRTLKYLLRNHFQGCAKLHRLLSNFWIWLASIWWLTQFVLWGSFAAFQGFFFLLPSRIQLTRSPLLQGKSETSLSHNFFSTSIAGITKLLCS